MQPNTQQPFRVMTVIDRVMRRRQGQNHAGYVIHLLNPSVPQHLHLWGHLERHLKRSSQQAHSTDDVGCAAGISKRPARPMLSETVALTDAMAWGICQARAVPRGVQRPANWPHVPRRIDRWF